MHSGIKLGKQAFVLMEIILVSVLLFKVSGRSEPGGLCFKLETSLSHLGIYRLHYWHAFISHFFIICTSHLRQVQKHRGWHFRPEELLALLVTCSEQAESALRVSALVSPQVRMCIHKLFLHFNSLRWILVCSKWRKARVELIKESKKKTSPNIKLGRRLAFSKVRLTEQPLCK